MKGEKGIGEDVCIFYEVAHCIFILTGNLFGAIETKQTG